MERFLVVSKSAVLVSFFLTYCGILYWVLRRKSKRLEEYRKIPLSED